MNLDNFAKWTISEMTQIVDDMGGLNRSLKGYVIRLGVFAALETVSLILQLTVNKGFEAGIIIFFVAALTQIPGTVRIYGKHKLLQGRFDALYQGSQKLIGDSDGQ